MIVGMNHFTVIAQDREQTLAFYVGLLGMRVGPRPELGFPGAWLYGDGPDALLHMYLDRPLPQPPAGVIDHMAFSATGLKDVKARFDAAGVTYDLRRQPGAGTWQLFSHDPNGAKVELDFAPHETSE
jgi:catechol 2,3-dioxygenase-like lactoylglutathione lyase family enzyme